MFQNWLHYAGRWLHDTEHLVVVAEDEDVVKPLQAMTHNASRSNFTVYVSSHPLGEARDASPVRRASLRQSVPESDHPAPLYDSKGFGDLVTQRATHMLAFLDRGCTVLYSDIDNVWIHDPFRQIALLPRKDLIATDDEPQNSTHTYACTCFLYVQPTTAATDLMHAWHERAAGQSTNQRPFNQVLAEARERYVNSFTDALLPFAEFPPGTNATQFPNASVIHANWIHGGLPKKIEFLEERGLWHAGNHRAGKTASQGQPGNRLIRLLFGRVQAGWNSSVNGTIIVSG